jgi:phage-related protein
VRSIRKILTEQFEGEDEKAQVPQAAPKHELDLAKRRLKELLHEEV